MEAHEAKKVVLDAKIRINAKNPGSVIDPMFYGAYFEEYNYNTCGGLYAEKVKNRSFEDRRNHMDGWTIRTSPDACAVSKVVVENPLNSENPHSLKLDIMEPGGGISVINTGYWGMGIKEGEAYQVSFYARSKYIPYEEVIVRLESETGKILAQPEESTPIHITGKDWKKYDVRLIAEETDEKARLVLLFTSIGTVWLDFVSVFPEKTWRNRENGLRHDVAQLRYEQNFGHIKWSGGCPIHMGTVDEIWRPLWGLRPLEERHNYVSDSHYNGTWVDDGLGYHEYLQFNEDMGTVGIFAIFSGIFCPKNNFPPVPMEFMDEYVQEAIHAIDYANEPPTGEFGSIRANLFKHPEPFNLKYIEIGNEDYLRDNTTGKFDIDGHYQKRWELFYNAIKEKYPEIRIIANGKVNDDLELPIVPQPDIVDVHFYKDKLWFFKNHRIFDGYDRCRPQILVGEFDSIDEIRKFEERFYAPPVFADVFPLAAFITGCERNADIVKMICCFGGNISNAECKSGWEPNDIYLNSSSSYGAPKYHLAKMFSQNRADVIIPVTEIWWESNPYEPSTGFLSDDIDRMYASAGKDNTTGEIIIKVVNASSVPRDTEISIDGVDRLKSEAIIHVMTGALDDCNDFSYPDRIAPKSSSIEVCGTALRHEFPAHSNEVCGTAFRHEFPAHSITVMRLCPEK